MNFKSFCFALTMSVLADGASAAVWTLVADRSETMPLDRVVCLIASDGSDRMMVVGLDKTLDGVGCVRFEQTENSSLNAVQDISNKDISILSVNNIITVSGLAVDSPIEIYTSDGRLLRSINLTASGYDIEINVCDLAAGIYIVKISESSFKIIKQ